MARNLSDLIRTNSSRLNPAVIDLSKPDQPVRRGYAELDQRIDAVARGLRKSGRVRGETVAILSLNRVEFIEALFGAMRAGCVPVPVNIKLPKDTIEFILTDAGTKFHFVDAGSGSSLPASLSRVKFGEDYENFLDHGPFKSEPVTDRDLCAMPYTSGTTGRPKGVYLTHSGQRWAAEFICRHRRLSPKDRALISAPFFHKNALVAVKTGCVAGATLVILPRFDARTALRAIHDYKITMVTGVPTMLYMLMAETDLVEKLDLTSVTTVSMGSAPASETLIQRIEQTFSNCTVRFNYGITEGGPIMAGWFHPEGKSAPLGNVGYPMPGCELRFENGPNNKEGELIARNPGVALGYHNLPDATAEKFKDGWFRTGDILRQDEDGWLYFVGRVDDMFVCGGENIFPSEVVLRLERHPEIAQAVIIPFDDDRKGQVPFAFIKCTDNAAITEEDVRQFALENGPAYAHPRRVLFVDDFPLSGTNKIDQAALRRLAEMAPAESSTGSSN